jgi:hypothetical protein
LIEGVDIGDVDARKDRGGAFAVGAADEGLVGEDTAGLEVNDGLEGHRDVEVPPTVAALATTDFKAVKLRHHLHPSRPG